jgi:hypothetical protein
MKSLTLVLLLAIIATSILSINCLGHGTRTGFQHYASEVVKSHSGDDGEKQVHYLSKIEGKSCKQICRDNGYKYVRIAGGDCVCTGR